MKIISTNDYQKEGIKCLIIGAPGKGKTFQASTLNHKKTLVINIENGLKTLENFDIPTIDITRDDEGRALGAKGRHARLSFVLKELNSAKFVETYDNIFFDSITEVSDILFDVFEIEFPDKRNTMQLYGALQKKLQQFCKQVRDLPQYNIFVTALERVEKDDIGKMSFLPSVKGSLAHSLAKYFDEVYSLQTIVKDKEIKRFFQTIPINGYEGKSRSNKLNTYEPAHLGEILDKLGQKQKKAKAKLVTAAVEKADPNNSERNNI